MSPQQKPQNHPAGCTTENTHFPNLRKSSQRGQEDKSNHSTDTFSNNLSFYLSFCLNFLIKSIFHIFDLPLMNNHINYSRHFFYIWANIFFPKPFFLSHTHLIQLPIMAAAQGISDFVLGYQNVIDNNKTCSATVTESGKKPPLLQNW